MVTKSFDIMNIAEITTYEEGGAYTHVVEIVKGIDANFLIVSGNTKKSGYQKNGKSTFFHVPCLVPIWDIFFVNRPGSYEKVVNALEKNKIDVVHFHSPLFTFLIGLIRKKKFSLIMTAHYLLDIKANRAASILYQKFIRAMTISIAKKVDKIICVNEDYLSVFTSWGVDPEKLVYIPNGVDTKKFSPGPSIVKKKFQDEQLIVYFGRLHYQKNVDILIQSFKQIKNKIPRAKLAIIGDGVDFQKLKKMSASDKDIIMTGFLSDKELVDYLRAADITVFPSRGENASFTLLEAMACGLPVISSDVGTAKKLLADERGVILENYSEEEIAKQCVLLLRNRETAKQMGERARVFVQQQFSWENISKETEKLYRKIVKEGKERTAYSIIIPTLNEEKNIGSCIREIQKQAPSAEIIVVDGMSSDRTVEIARELGATVVFEKKRSVGAARTAGLKQAHGDVVCFVDADALPAKSWFENLVRPFADERVVGVGGRALPLDGTILETLGMWMVFGLSSSILFKMGIPLVTGQNMAFRRTAVLQTGGFLEVVKSGGGRAEGEDTNMFLRIKKKGKIAHSNSYVKVSMRRIRAWGLPRYVLFNIRNYLHLLKYQTPIDEDYGPIR